MISIALGVFAAAMLFASVRHVLAFLRRERVLSEMHAALVVAGRSSKRRTSRPDEGKAPTLEKVAKITDEYPITRGVLIGRPPELRHEAEASDPGSHAVNHIAI